MMRSLVIAVSLLCLPPGAYPQAAPELSSLIFTPGPTLNEVRSQIPTIDDSRLAADDETEDDLRARLLDAIPQIEDSIEAEESLNGGRSSNLIEPLVSLAAAHHELEDYIRAIGYLEQARQIRRINDGLHSLDQAEIVNRMIDSLEAVGSFSESDSLQDSLLELAMVNAGDPRAPSIVAAVAHRQMNAVNDYLEAGVWSRSREKLPVVEGSGWEPTTFRAGRQRSVSKLGQIRARYDGAIEDALASDGNEFGDSLGPEEDLATTYIVIDTVSDFIEEGPLPRRIPGRQLVWEPEDPINDRAFALQTFRRARRLYSAAMQAALKEGQYDEYLEYEEQLIETFYFELAHPEIHPTRVERRAPSSLGQIIYLPAINVLEAKVIHRLANGASAIDVATALVELGDWHLLFSQNGTALEWYHQAYDLLVRKDVAIQIVTDLFSPQVPMLLPAFASVSADFEPARGYRGYIDASIKIGRYGESKGVKLVGGSSSTSSDIGKRLTRELTVSRFRPRFVDGKAIRSDQFLRRFYFDY
jgi:tetratricopeptide (TPR) repeat protein